MGAFDVSMVSCDGAGICDLVEIFLLGKLKDAFLVVYFSNYKDDVLAMFKNLVENINKRISKFSSDDNPMKTYLIMFPQHIIKLF